MNKTFFTLCLCAFFFLVFGCTTPKYVVPTHSFSDLNIGIYPNYSYFDSNGTLTQYGEATTWTDALSPIVVQANASQAPSWDATYMQYFFHNDILVQQDFVFVQIQLPHSYKNGSDIECHVHWAPSSTNTGDVNFSLQYSFVPFGGTYSLPYKQISTKQAGSGVAMKSQIMSFPDINGSGMTASGVLVGKLMRESASLSDSFTGDAYVTYFDCHFEQDKLGTNNRYS